VGARAPHAGAVVVKVALGWVLLAALLGFLASHVAICVALGRARGLRHGLLALVLLPLAPAWAWREGMRRHATGWLVALAVYACGVAAA